MKTAKMAAAVYAIFSGCLAWAQAPDLSGMDLVLRSAPDGPVARINGVTISRQEFVSLYKNELMALMSTQGDKPVPDRIRLETGIHSIGMLVQREILFQEAQKRGVTIPDAEFAKLWGEEIARLRGSVPHPAGRDLSEEELVKAAGATVQDAKSQFGKALVVERMSEIVAKEKNVTVSDREIADFYEKNKASFRRPARIHFQQIFVNTRPGGTPLGPQKKAEARQHMETALKRIQAGETFEAVARSVSEAPDKNEGGDMGMLPTVALPPFLLEAAAKMKPNDISGIVESELGYHVVKLLGTEEGGEVTLDTAKPKIRQILLADKMSDAVAEFCEPVVKKPGAVEVYLQFEKTLKAMGAFEERPADAEASSKEAAPAKEPVQEAVKAPAKKSGKKSKK